MSFGKAVIGLLAASVASLLDFSSAFEVVGGPSSPINVTAHNYTDDEGALLQGFLSIPPNTGPIPGNGYPAVVILHDSSGVDAYEKQRATMLAQQLGYVAFAADIFGVYAEMPTRDFRDPKYRAFMGQFNNNPAFFVQRIRAAVDFVKSLDIVDANNVAMIGYCFGGTGVIQYVYVGETGATAGVVAFHPSLSPDTPGPVANITPPVLVITGGSDFLTSPMAMMTLEGNLNSAQATWETVRYAGINHAWTNWFSPNYDERADARSWYSMKSFLGFQFGHEEYDTQPPLPASTNVDAVAYADKSDNGFALQGYLSVPNDVSTENPVPAVIILPDMDGPTLYEKQRAAQISQEFGFIGFVADIYGYDVQTSTAISSSDLDNQAQMYLEKKELYVSRIQAAVDFIKDHALVDSDNIAVMGYSFGGTGSIYYTLIGDTSKVKSVASFHGGLLNGLPNAATTNSDVQIFIASGADHDNINDIIELEEIYMAQNAQYEISRYSNAQDGFTVWNGDNFDEYASSRSFDSMYMLLEEVFDVTKPAPFKTSASSNNEGMDTPTTSGVVSVLTNTIVFYSLGLGVLLVSNFFL